MKHTLRFPFWWRSPRRSQWRKKLQAAALTVGLATAWGGEASAETIVRLEVSPTRTLYDAHVYYANNNSSARFLSLGTLPAGELSVFTHILNGQFDDAPEDLLPSDSRPNVGYWVIGTFEERTRVSVSFRDETLPPVGAEWSEVFAYSEAGVAGGIVNPGLNDFYYFESAYGDPLYKPQAILPTHYGKYSTLVNFSAAEYGGTAFARVIPEPSSVILVTMAGAVWGVAAVHRRAASSRQRTNGSPCN